MFNTFFLLHRFIYRVLWQKDFEKPPSQRTSKDNSGNIANVVIFFYVLESSKENCFTLPFYCTVLYAGRSTKEGLNLLLHEEFLRKNKKNIANISIQFYITIFSQKYLTLSVYCIVLYFHFTALCYVQGDRKKLPS